MSSYDDDRRRRRQPRERSAEDYDRQSTYRSSRDTDKRSLVRRDSSASSVEEVTRDFPPGDRGGYYKETTVRKKGRGPPRDDRYSDRERDYASSKKSSRGYDDRRSDKGYDDRRSDKRDVRSRYQCACSGPPLLTYLGDRKSRRDYSSDSSPSRTPPKRERRKSTAEELLGSLGLGGAVGALLGNKKDKDRDDSRSRSRTRRGRSADDRRSRSRGGGNKKRDKSIGRDQIIQALKAAGLAAAGEAFRARKDPGGWGGEKSKRIMTAAISAAGVDGLISNNKDPKQHGTRDVIGSALAGLATNRIVNGPRSKSRGGSPDGRGRSESRGGGGGGLGELASAGVLAAAGKKAYDKFRSRSRGRERSRSVSSYDSRDSRTPPRRNRSVSAHIKRGLAAVGFGGAAADKADSGRRRDSRRYDDNYYENGNAAGGPGGPGGPPGGGYGYQESRDVSSVPRAGPDAMAITGPHHYSFDTRPHHTGDPDTDSDSDLGSSSGEDKEVKKNKRRQMITAGLATVASIHAAHSVYQAKQKRDANKKALAEGEISPEQAKRSRNKQRWAEAGALGIAALGIKGAYSEWKEMQDQRHEYNEKKEARERHAVKRENRRRKYDEEMRRYKESGYTGPMPTMPQDYHDASGPPRPNYNPGYAASQPQLSSYVATPPASYYDGNGPFSAGPQPGPYRPHEFPPPPGGGQYPPPPPPTQQFPPPPAGTPYPPYH